MGHIVQLTKDKTVSYDKLILTTKQDRGTIKIEIWIQDEDVSDCFIIVEDLYDTIGFQMEFDRECEPDRIKELIDEAILKQRIKHSLILREELIMRGINVRH